MHEVEKMHETASAAIISENPNFDYREKPRKVVAHTYLYMIGKRLCENIFDYSIDDWTNWFQKYVVHVSVYFLFAIQTKQHNQQFFLYVMFVYIRQT